ncbi:unnamed protein product [Gulo gulo]|uniref:Uncharacterized protein n=1 Tax=Gulo gulo TaxID=48420 RepID=A0A9X9PY00_GULGU|nr:unnamed protein product [Gulo gulo]
MLEYKKIEITIFLNKHIAVMPYWIREREKEKTYLKSKRWMVTQSPPLRCF